MSITDRARYLAALALLIAGAVISTTASADQLDPRLEGTSLQIALNLHFAAVGSFADESTASNGTQHSPLEAACSELTITAAAIAAVMDDSPWLNGTPFDSE